MKKKGAFYLAAGAALCLLWSAPAWAQKKEIIQLQAKMETLQQQMRDLQRTVDDRTAVLKTLVEQAVDAVNRMSATVSQLERAVQESRANTDARVDSLATQVQALRDSMDEMNVRMAKLSEQLAETRNVLQSVDARLTEPPRAMEGTLAESPEVPASTTSGVPSAKALYDAALRDFIGGKYDLARQQFTDYLTYYPETLLAGNARFYIGETYYRQKEFRQAIAEYDEVLANYPKSYKIAAARLKKGYALIELNEREAGIQALRTLIREHPDSEEAHLARSRLQRLGMVRPGSR